MPFCTFYTRDMVVKNRTSANICFISIQRRKTQRPLTAQQPKKNNLLIAAVIILRSDGHGISDHPPERTKGRKTNTRA